jgi:hypothetical protein
MGLRSAKERLLSAFSIIGLYLLIFDFLILAKELEEGYKSAILPDSLVPEG